MAVFVIPFRLLSLPVLRFPATSSFDQHFLHWKSFSEVLVGGNHVMRTQTNSARSHSGNQMKLCLTQQLVHFSFQSLFNLSSVCPFIFSSFSSCFLSFPSILHIFLIFLPFLYFSLPLLILFSVPYNRPFKFWKCQAICAEYSNKSLWMYQEGSSGLNDFLLRPCFVKKVPSV